jgi:hypothetical protein
MVAPHRAPTSPTDAARLFNAALGVWLVISAFAWPHTPAQRTNAWIVGVLAFVISLAAASALRLRFLNTILAVWLFISAFALPRISSGTLWNNVLVSIAIFVTSLMPSESWTPPGAARSRVTAPGT